MVRYVYKRDPVPHLPPKDSDDFQHFGREYRYEGSYPWKDTSDDPIRQIGHVLGLIEAPLAFVARQFRLALALILSHSYLSARSRPRLPRRWDGAQPARPEDRSVRRHRVAAQPPGTYSIDKAQMILCYQPLVSIDEGMNRPKNDLARRVFHRRLTPNPQPADASTTHGGIEGSKSSPDSSESTIGPCRGTYQMHHGHGRPGGGEKCWG